MTTTEHLAKIRAKCAELLAEHENNAAGYVTQKHAVAGWKSTIAAIDLLEELNIHSQGVPRSNLEQQDITTIAIISAWPEDLL